MTTAEKIAIVEVWEIAHKALDAELDKLFDLLKIDPSCALCEAIWAMQANATANASKAIGDTASWLDWYASEVGFRSKSELYTIINGKRMKAKDAKGIVKIIEAYHVAA